MKYYLIVLFVTIFSLCQAQESVPTLEGTDSIFIVKKTVKDGKTSFKLAATRFNNGDPITREFAMVDSATVLQIVLGSIFEEYRAISKMNKESVIRSQRAAGLVAFRKFTNRAFSKSYEELVTPLFAKGFSGAWEVRGSKGMIIAIDTTGNAIQVADANGKQIAKDAKPAQGKISVLSDTSFKLEGILDEPRIFDLFDKNSAINLTQKGVEYVLIKIQ